MRHSRKQLTVIGAVSITLLAAAPSVGQTLSSDCVALQGGSFGLGASIGIGADLFAGETVTVNKLSSAEVVVASTIGGAAIQTTVGTTHSFYVPADGMYYWTSTDTSNTASWDCTNVPPVLATNDTAEMVSVATTVAAANQHYEMSSATSRIARERLLQGDANGMTSRGVFMSTQGLGQSRLDRPEYNFWVSGGYTNFSGEQDGHSTDLLMGVDRLFGENFLLGLMLAYGNTELEQGGIESEVRSPALGAYFANRFAGDLLLDGHIAFARPEASAGGGSVTGEQVSASLALTGSYDLPSGTLRPFFQIGGYDQHLPAYTNSSGAVVAEDTERFDANLGARFEAANPLGATGLMPYVSLAAGYGLTDSSTTGRDEYVYPRVGLGLSGDVAGGYLSVDLDGRRMQSDTYGIGLNLSWEMTF